MSPHAKPTVERFVDFDQKTDMPALKKAEVPQFYPLPVEDIRARYFTHLADQVYLDHAGTTIYSTEQIRNFQLDLTTHLYGNPHSRSPSSALSTRKIDAVRSRVLEHFNVTPGDYDLVFTANATASIKLVAEIFPWQQGSHFVCLQESHTSILGIRGIVNGIEGTSASMTSEQDIVQNNYRLCNHDAPSLFAYPAQCNFSGTRFPLALGQDVKRQNPNVKVLLDAASYCTSTLLDLSDTANSPDFITFSFYKMFGSPTGLGGLLIKKCNKSILKKSYFGGGTIAAIVASEPWQRFHATELHDIYEDGTVNFLDIISLDHAMDTWSKLFLSFRNISNHVNILTTMAYDTLQALAHYNGKPLCTFYNISASERRLSDPTRQGPILNFNLRRANGSWIGGAEVEKIASLTNIHIRSGGFCNPGSNQYWLHLTPDVVKDNYAAGHVCGDDVDLLNDVPTGSLRISFGAMSSLQDIEKFVAFLRKYFIETEPASMPPIVHTEHTTTNDSSNAHIQDLIIYPIKSCHGYHIPASTSWTVTPQGLLYDREWMLVSAETGLALSQKRYTKMCAIRPELSVSNNTMTVNAPGMPALIISLEPTQDELSSIPICESRVCGESIGVHRYNDSAINNWFSEVLGVEVSLARHPISASAHSRFLKPHLQANSPSGDTKEPTSISLSNESPFLLVSAASADDVQTKIDEFSDTREQVNVTSFRGNIVIGGQALTAFEEDQWKRISIGSQQFELLGPCRRCHMVCINQETAEKTKEPFVTLALYRRIQGQVLFGQHMVHVPSLSQFPYTLRIGDPVVVQNQR
ncbi:hypothetical protein BZG36_01662 [Bifiguratus adelaidae]|uniref:Molybdenum cofactor sulfurase n=1 Tax=Bifiguratus adelaidae TaxID=1938954 RepID=A0A261Y4A3_9FUNG|nr:hypothetical protein BZG36_01662 [Bifiguratus adelaidae]